MQVPGVIDKLCSQYFEYYKWTESSNAGKDTEWKTIASEIAIAQQLLREMDLSAVLKDDENTADNMGIHLNESCRFRIQTRGSSKFDPDIFLAQLREKSIIFYTIHKLFH